MPRPTRQHACRSLIWGMLFLATLHASAEFWLPPLVERYRDPAYYVRRDQLLERMNEAAAESRRTGKAQPPLALMIGTSRTLNGLDGATAEKSLREALSCDVRVANFGDAGASHVYELIVLGRLIRDAIQPDLVLIEVLPKHFGDKTLDDLFQLQSQSLVDSDEEWLKEQGLDSELAAARQFDLPAFWAYRKELLYVFAPKLLDPDTVTNFGNCDVCGGRHWDRHKKLTKAELAASVKQAWTNFGQEMQTFEFQEPGFDCLRKMLVECQERNIPTAMVIMPEGPLFRSWYRPGAHEEILERLNQLARETNSRVINAWEWIDDDNEFRDSHHLTTSGSLAFTGRLARSALFELIRETRRFAETTTATKLR